MLSGVFSTGGSQPTGKVHETLAMVECARADGIDVHSDVYPYTAGATVLSAMFLPLWAFEGSQERLLERLRDPATRKKIIADRKQRLMKFAQLPGVLDRIFPKKLLLPFVLHELSKLVVISSVRKQHQYEGMTLRDVMKSRKQSLYEGLLDLLIEEDLAVSAIAHVMSEDDLRTVLSHPTTMVGTDGFPQREGKRTRARTARIHGCSSTTCGGCASSGWRRRSTR